MRILNTLILTYLTQYKLSSSNIYIVNYKFIYFILTILVIYPNLDSSFFENKLSFLNSNNTKEVILMNFIIKKVIYKA